MGPVKPRRGCELRESWDPLWARRRSPPGHRSPTAPFRYRPNIPRRGYNSAGEARRGRASRRTQPETPRHPASACARTTALLPTTIGPCPRAPAHSFFVQFPADPVDRLGDMPFDGPDADVETIGDLAVAEFVHAMKQEHLARARRKVI